VHVTALSLTDFRCYAQVDLELRPGVTSFLGSNGQGKTNLVEALGYVASLDSHRVSTDAPLVRLGASQAVVRAAVAREGRSTLVEIEINPGRANRARINRSPVPRPREVLGLLRVVLFAPEDLALVKGDPSERRRFLDDLLVARSPRMAAVRADYDRVLKQRNALLKTASAARRGGSGAGEVMRTLEVWDTHLVSVGAEILEARLDLVASLQPYVDKAYDTVSAGGGPAQLEYVCSLGPDVELVPERAALTDLLLAGIERRRRDELDRGVSLVGPHRDELMLRLGPSPAKGYASHGESWSYALALRLASYELLRHDGSAAAEPVLVLDDVFAELDVHRRERLAGVVSEAEQVLVTAAVEADVPAALVGERVHVAHGEVSRAG
jgi:DNA replication and repair protein RecF